MKFVANRSWAVVLLVGFLEVASPQPGAAEERESKPTSALGEEPQVESPMPHVGPPRWNPSFVFGATQFGPSESDSHQTLGASVRIRLTNRLSLEPELRYLTLPGVSFESTRNRIEASHSDLELATHVVYDLRSNTSARVIPYAMGGAGWIRSQSRETATPLTIENGIPVVPAPSAPPQPRTTKSVYDALWMGGGFGVRIGLVHGVFVSPEIKLGFTNSEEGTASAAIKLGYGF